MSYGGYGILGVWVKRGSTVQPRDPRYTGTNKGTDPLMDAF